MIIFQGNQYYCQYNWSTRKVQQKSHDLHHRLQLAVCGRPFHKTVVSVCACTSYLYFRQKCVYTCVSACFQHQLVYEKIVKLEQLYFNICEIVHFLCVSLAQNHFYVVKMVLCVKICVQCIHRVIVRLLVYLYQRLFKTNIYQQTSNYQNILLTMLTRLLN